MDHHDQSQMMLYNGAKRCPTIHRSNKKKSYNNNNNNNNNNCSNTSAGPAAAENEESTTRHSNKLDELQVVQQKNTTKNSSNSINNNINHNHNTTIISFGCGLSAGTLSAGIFSPFDRALYLSIINQEKFLSHRNFQNPFHGIYQSIGGRALAAGCFFPLEQFFRTNIPLVFDNNNNNNIQQQKRYRRNNEAIENFLAGTMAGAVNAMIINPVSAVKYKMWRKGKQYSRGMIYEILSMIRKTKASGTGKYALSPFMRGTIPTLLRDISFGGSYTLLRLQIPKMVNQQYQQNQHNRNQHKQQHHNQHQQWMYNLIAASLATIVSGPFNFARNIQYASKTTETMPSTRQILVTLIEEANQFSPRFSQRILYISARLRIGWGTARVAMGITLGHYVYDQLLHVFLLPTEENETHHHNTIVTERDEEKKQMHIEKETENGRPATTAAAAAASHGSIILHRVTATSPAHN